MKKILYPPGGKTHFTIFGDQGPPPTPPSPSQCQIERTKSQVFGDALKKKPGQNASNSSEDNLDRSPTTMPDVFHASDFTWTLRKIAHKRQSDLYVKYNQSQILY